MALLQIWRLAWWAIWTTLLLPKVSATSDSSASLWAAAWSQNGNKVATGGNAGDLWIWQASAGALAPLARLDGHSGPVYAVSWSPDGTRLVSGGSDGSVRIWDMSGNDPSEWGQLRLLEQHIFSVRVTLWAPCGGMVLSGGDGFKIRIWDVADQNASLWRSMDGSFPGVVHAAAWSPDCSRAITGGSSGLELWQVRGGLKSTEAALNVSGRVRAIAWASGSSLLAAGGDDGILRLWWAPSVFLDWQELRPLQAPSAEPITAAAWSPNVHQIAAATYDGSVFVWDLQEHGRHAMGSEAHNLQHLLQSAESLRPQVLRGAGGAISALTWSPDASMLVVAGYGGMALWCTLPGERKLQSCGTQRTEPTKPSWSLPWRSLLNCLPGLVAGFGLLVLSCFSLWQAGNVCQHGLGKDERTRWHRRACICVITFAWVVVIFGLCITNPWLRSYGAATAAAIEQAFHHCTSGMQDPRVLLKTTTGIVILDDQPWWQSDLLVLGAFLALSLTVVALWLLWFMLRSLYRAARQLSHPGAFFAVTSTVVALLIALLLLAEWSFAHLFSHNAPRFALPPLAPPALWFVVHAASLLMSVGRLLVHITLWLRTLVMGVWKVFVTIAHCRKLINCIVPYKEADAYAQTVTDVRQSRPLLEKAGFPVLTIDSAPRDWAAALFEVMHEKDQSAFDVDTDNDIYKSLEEALKKEGRASLRDLLRFPLKYLQSLWTNLYRCFYRQLWIDNTLLGLRACQKEVALELEKLAGSSDAKATEMAERRYQHWQVLEDQFMWYHAHSLVLVDVLAFMAACDERMSRVVKLWKALDDAISSVLPRILFPRLWKPTPSVRRQSLLSRLGNVSKLARGAELTRSSPTDGACSSSPAEDLALKQQCDSLKAKLATVQNLVSAAREVGAPTSSTA